MQIEYLGDQAGRLEETERKLLKSMFAMGCKSLAVGAYTLETTVKHGNTYIVKIQAGEKCYPRYVRVKVSETPETITSEEFNAWEFLHNILETSFENGDALFAQTVRTNIRTVQDMFIRHQRLMRGRK